jgi:uncharacterized protein YceH (UPF0502 family)
MNIQLNAEESRVIGCLMEKSVTTPDQYPLTLNALTNACNQKSSREPVMNLHQGEVQRSCNELKAKHLISIETGFKSGAEKYTQRLCNTLLSECQFDEAEYAIVCLLLLRGSQTPGELRSRAGRLYQFQDNQEVTESLKALMDRQGGPIIARLSKQPGRQDHEYTQLFQGDVESVAEDLDVAQRTPTPNRDQQMIKLEARIEVLERELVKLGEQLGEEVNLENPASIQNLNSD